MSGDGSKIFGLGIHSIEALYTETGGDAGRVELGVWTGFKLYVHGSKVGIEQSRGNGWDFGGPKVSDFGGFTDLDRPRLDLTIVLGDKPRWIKDAVTKRLVFRLPEQYMKPHTKRSWDGRYLLVWSRSGEVVIMDFDPVFPQ